jgi:peptidoglycan hydrolase-like protein with peptidoglycan-binding domain
MKATLLLLLLALTCAFSVSAQTSATSTTAASAPVSKPAKKIFRANKDQIKQVQAMLKTKGLYTGEATGTLDDSTRVSIKNYQKDNGLKQTGTLNRATLEKMGIGLTEAQKAIPVSESSYASSDANKASGEAKPKRTIFRATKDQVAEAQKTLKTNKLYSGDETGKLDDATRDGLKKYQEANGLKVTGTLNQATLEKMGITLTDKQKGNGSASQK